MANRRSGVIILLALCCSSASAETTADITAGLAAYTATPEHRAAAMAAVRPYYALLPSCTPGTAKRIGLRIVAPVSLDAAGAITGGAWVEQVKVEGCATSGLFNVYTLIRTGSPPLVGGLLPGATLAPLTLQRDALPTARGLASTALPAGCADIHAIDTALDGFGEGVAPNLPPSRDARTRRERWVFLGCGQQTTVIMRFTPDETGTSFVGEVDKVAK